MTERYQRLFIPPAKMARVQGSQILWGKFAKLKLQKTLVVVVDVCYIFCQFCLATLLFFREAPFFCQQR